MKLNNIVGEQKNCPDLIENLQSKKSTFTKRTFGTIDVVVIVDERDGGKAKIYVPQIHRDNLIAWFHNNLHHPSEDGTRNTIKQHFAWPGISKIIDARSAINTSEKE